MNTKLDICKYVGMKSGSIHYISQLLHKKTPRGQGGKTGRKWKSGQWRKWGEKDFPPIPERREEEEIGGDVKSRRERETLSFYFLSIAVFPLSLPPFLHFLFLSPFPSHLFASRDLLWHSQHTL